MLPTGADHTRIRRFYRAVSQGFGGGKDAVYDSLIIHRLGKNDQMESEQDISPTRKKAVALRYRRGEDSAPHVVAKGSGYIAEQILAIAREHDIPLYQDPDLVEVLAKVELGDVIPPELYKAVAEVLAFVYNLNRKMIENESRI